MTVPPVPSADRRSEDAPLEPTPFDAPPEPAPTATPPPEPDATAIPSGPAWAQPSAEAPGSPPGPPPPTFRTRSDGDDWRTILVAVGVAFVVAAAGLGLGYLWVTIAPRIAVIRTQAGFVYADAEPEQAVAADAWFAIIGLGAGVVFTLLAWALLRRYRGVAMLVGLVVGSLAGAWLAWWLGVRLGTAQFDAIRATAALGDRVEAPLGLRLTDLNKNALWPPKVTGVATAQAFVAAITYTMLAGFSMYPSLRGPDPVDETTLLNQPDETDVEADGDVRAGDVALRADVGDSQEREDRHSGPRSD